MSFASDSVVTGHPSSPEEVSATIGGLDYWGGGRNVGDALRACQDVMREGVILIITDGCPERGYGAVDAADSVKQGGTRILHRRYLTMVADEAP